jgi:type II secretion system (T2SS) protein N
MPTSPSAKRSTSANRTPGGKRSGAAPPPARSSIIKPLILVVVLAIIVVAIVALPASMISRFLPPSLVADDFSGTLWHGSAGRLSLNSRSLGAVEWHLRPASLLRLRVSADVHWVKGGFVADGALDADSKGLTLTHVQGGGPVDDVADLGVGRGWHGTSTFSFSEVKVAFGGAGGDNPKLVSAIGDLSVANVTSAMVADGADLGGYTLHMANGAITPDSDASAELSDTGGPLEIQATIHLSATGHSGMLSGTVRERPGAPLALHKELDNLAQLHARDASGRIPVDLEFTL